jgi:GTP-binding protein Era
MRRAGFAAIIGAPNAGKSTLVNRLVGSKVSIVTRKVQTTRFAVRGIAVEGETQIVLVDTPGIFVPRRRLDRAMVKAAWKGADDADAIVHVVDAEAHDSAGSGSGSSADRLAVRDSMAITKGLGAAGKRAILAVNKIDRVRKERLLALVDGLFDDSVYDEVFLISASSGSGVADLKRRLGGLMPEGTWLYPDDSSADIPMRVLAAEITREKLYDRVHEELPYSASVETTAYAEKTDGSVRIEQTIFVEREGQRAILIGRNGATLKSIGKSAREEIGDLIGRPTHLFIHVKVKAGWAEDRALYQNFGLEFDA